jgi:hypothetical protein
VNMTPRLSKPSRFSLGIGSSIAFGLIIAVVIAFNIYWFSLAVKVHVTRADDSIIAFFPAGLNLAGKSLKEFFIGLISGFRYEDHFYPLGILWGYILQIFFRDAVAASEIPAKIFYILNLGAITGLSYLLWRSKLKTCLTFVLFGLNYQVNQRMILGNYHPLTLPLALLTLFCLIRVLDDFKPFRLFYFGFSFFLLSLPLESGFAIFPVFGILALGDILGLRPGNRQELNLKIKKLTFLFATVIIAFLPYLIGHYFIYGSFIPKSSNPMQVTLKAIAINVMELIKMVFYGVSGIEVTYVFFGLMTALFFPKFRKLFFSLRGAFLFLSLLAQFIIIALTNRIEAGLWVFTGVLICFVLADVLGNLAFAILNAYWGKKFHVQIFGAYLLLFCVCGLAVSQASELKSLYSRKSIDFNIGEQFHKWNAFYEAFYRVVNEPVDEFTIIQLADSRVFGALEVYWLGNKLFHGDSGLKLYPEAFVFLNRNMRIWAYYNREKKPFSFFESYLRASPNDKRVVTLKGESLFHRVFLDSSQNRLVHVEVTELSDDNSYSLYLPQVEEKKLKSLPIQATLTFDEDPSKVISAISYNGFEIKNLVFKGSTVLISQAEWGTEGMLKLDYASEKLKTQTKLPSPPKKKPELISVDIRLSEPLLNYVPRDSVKKESPSQLIQIETGKDACSLGIKNSELTFWGIFEGQEKFTLHPILPFEYSENDILKLITRPIIKDRKIGRVPREISYKNLELIKDPCKILGP